MVEIKSCPMDYYGCMVKSHVFDEDQMIGVTRHVFFTPDGEKFECFIFDWTSGT